jgi:adenosine deaminase
MWIFRLKIGARLNCVRIQRLTSSMPMHPLPVLLNNGVPVALSCDDPSVFGNMGLTFDYFQVRVILLLRLF